LAAVLVVHTIGVAVAVAAVLPMVRSLRFQELGIPLQSAVAVLAAVISHQVLVLTHN
jgi:hypothetical protein